MNHNRWRKWGTNNASSIFVNLRLWNASPLSWLPWNCRLKGLPRMPVSLGPVSATKRSLKLVVARWSKELNTCRMPQGEGRGVMWGLWTFLRAAWHHVVVIVPCRQPQLTNCQNQGGRTTIQTKWWWDLSLQHFGGIDFNSTGWTSKHLPSSGASRSVI